VYTFFVRAQVCKTLPGKGSRTGLSLAMVLVALLTLGDVAGARSREEVSGEDTRRGASPNRFRAEDRDRRI